MDVLMAHLSNGFPAKYDQHDNRSLNNFFNLIHHFFSFIQSIRQVHSWFCFIFWAFLEDFANK